MSNSSYKSVDRPWFAIALLAIFILAFATRFWGLSRFNSLVFDEVHHALFANNYLTGKEFFDAHPPVARYFIAIGIWLGSFFPASSDTINNLTGSNLSTFSYRWFNAIFGSFIPIFIGVIAYYISERRSYCIIAALLAALDGLFLVESRYALNNIYIVFFGLLGHIFFLSALRSSEKKSRLLSWAGIFLGASIASKWNGLGYAGGIYSILIIAAIVKYYNAQLKPIQNKNITSQSSRQKRAIILPQIWQNLYRYNARDIIGNLVFLPFVTYSLLWIPHLIMCPQYNFIEVHQQMIGYHQRMGDGQEVHPYCSPWYSWLIMWRPMAYFFQQTLDKNEVIPNYPPLPAKTGNFIFDVHALGNPILWWLSTAAMLILFLLFIQSFAPKWIGKNLSHPPTWIVIYIVCSYTANMLPWIKVTRCLFIYHYMPAYAFSWLAIAWIIDRFLERENLVFFGSIMTSAIVLAFIYWLPIYLGLPLTRNEYNLRMWFSNWI